MISKNAEIFTMGIDAATCSCRVMDLKDHEINCKGQTPESFATLLAELREETESIFGEG